MFWADCSGFTPKASCHGAGFVAATTQITSCDFSSTLTCLRRPTILRKDDLESTSEHADPRLNVQHITETKLHTCGHFDVKGLPYFCVITSAYAGVKCCFPPESIYHVPVITKPHVKRAESKKAGAVSVFGSLLYLVVPE